MRTKNRGYRIRDDKSKQNVDKANKQIKSLKDAENLEHEAEHIDKDK
jgi:hypothetical protein